MLIFIFDISILFTVKFKFSRRETVDRLVIRLMQYCLWVIYYILKWCLGLYGSGLDPYIGFYHQLDYSRESLACDVVELFRGLYDAWSVDCF